MDMDDPLVNLISNFPDMVFRLYGSRVVGIQPLNNGHRFKFINFYNHISFIDSQTGEQINNGSKIDTIRKETIYKFIDFLKKENLYDSFLDELTTHMVKKI